MTPTEQDNELRDKVATIVEYWDFSPLQDEDSRIERLKSEIMQLITADRKRVALEARIDEVENQMDTYAFIPEDKGGQLNRKFRLKVLKAKQEEV